MTALTVVTGDDLNLPITLKKNSETFEIASGATITAALVSANRFPKKLGTAVTVDKDVVGTDLTASKIILQFNAAETATWPEGDWRFEIEVDDGGKLSWFYPVTVLKGSV